MKKQILRGALVIAFVMALLQGGFVNAADNPVANMVINPTLVYWEPLVSYDQLVLTVSGSGGAHIRQVFNAGSTPVFDLYDENGDLFPDGSCTYELTAVPYIDPGTRDFLTQNRDAGIDATDSTISLPTGQKQYGYFSIKDGLVLSNTVAENEPAAPAGDGIDRVQVTVDQTQDQLIQDDLIVIGSLCTGQDCVNGESFGFDTLRLKENNLRIHFQDTSNSSSFPSTDWRIIANDSTNGGASYLAIEDSDSGRTPFRVEANAPTGSLYVKSTGRVGIGTANPAVHLQVQDGNTPTLRLHQDGSQGFTAQVWDVAGNEANFFVRDATNGGKLQFRIQPGAPENSIYIENTGDVGFGTSSPDASLHVRSTDGSSQLHIEQVSPTATHREMINLDNNGGVGISMHDSSKNVAWWLQNTQETFRMNKEGTGVAEMEIDGAGNVIIQGELTTKTTTYPDYVFDSGYKLTSLSDLHDFVKEKKHLPGIPTAEEMKKNGVNMSELQTKLLEKVEELTLYTIAQQKVIDELTKRVDSLTK